MIFHLKNIQIIINYLIFDITKRVVKQIGYKIKIQVNKTINLA